MAIEKDLQKLDRKPNEDKISTLLKNPYICKHVNQGGTVSHITSDEELLWRTWRDAYSNAYNFIQGALYGATKYVPRWAQLNDRKDNFLNYKKSLMAINRFITETDTDLKINDLLDFQRKTANNYLNQSSPAQYMYMLSENGLEDNSEPNISKALGRLIEFFDCIQHCKISYGYEKNSLAEVKLFAYELSEYFSGYLGGPRYRHVANFVRVLFDQQTPNISTVRRWCKEISKQVEGNSAPT